jgi:hypothetical protein
MSIKRFLMPTSLLEYDGTNSAEILAACGFQVWGDPPVDYYPVIESEVDGVLTISFECPSYSKTIVMGEGDCITPDASTPEYARIYPASQLSELYVDLDTLTNP